MVDNDAPGGGPVQEAAPGAVELNEYDLNVLSNYARTCADRLMLKDWSIIVTNERPLDDSHIAECEVVYGQRVALLRFAHNLKKMDHYEVRHTIVHELLHIHFDPIDALMRNMLWADEEGVEERSHLLKYVRAMQHEHIELAVNAIASAISFHFPMFGSFPPGPVPIHESRAFHGCGSLNEAPEGVHSNG